MSKFFSYLLIVLLGVAILDGLNRLLIEFAYIHSPADSELNRNNRFISNCNAELLIIGASRGVYDYNTKMLSDSLHMSCQSISKEGMSVISQFVSVKESVNKGKTKIIIYDLSAVQLSDAWVENKTSEYYQYYWKNDEVKTFIEQQQGKKMKLFLLSSFVQYNSLLYDILYSGYVQKSKDKNGYVELEYTGELLEFNDENLNIPYHINQTGEQYLHQIIDVCKRKSVRLILCDSPRWLKNQAFDDYLEELAERNKIEFWDYSDFEPILSDKRYFADSFHLNSLGADLFTHDIIKRLRNISMTK